MLFNHIYGDLFECSWKKILDIGGGFSSLIADLSRQHKYTLVDILAHDAFDEERHGFVNLIQDDWFNIVPEYHDIIISNNLFPYVDQRLELFLDKFLPFCLEMRLSLTYYNFPKWYKTKRTDADEIMHLLQWNGRQVCDVLGPIVLDMEILEPLLNDNPQSLFENGRQICAITLKGGTL